MKTKNRVIRKIVVKGETYHWHVGAPDEDYGIVKLRVWRGKKVIITIFLRAEHQPVKPAFVAAQIDYHLEPVTFHRASGDCVCSCGKIYYDHPFDGPFTNSMGYDASRQWLHRLCNGDLVKL